MMAFHQDFQFVQHLSSLLLYAFSGAIGLFWGDFFASEFEKQTYKLALTQSITRTKWFIGKFIIRLGFIALISVIGPIILSWWFAKLDFINASI